MIRPIESGLDIVRARSQSDCELGFTFDQDACACFSERRVTIFCLTPRVINPLTGAGCISEEENQQIYGHGLGPTCGGKPPLDQTDTADRPIIRPLDPQDDRGRPGLPAIVRARSQADCADGTRFDQEACTCFSLLMTRQFCIPPSRQDPISGGPCVGQERIDEIYNHGLGELCGARPNTGGKDDEQT